MQNQKNQTMAVSINSAELICPISQDIMTNPYLHSNCGNSFDYDNIMILLARGDNRCPLCRNPIIPSVNFGPNRILKNIIETISQFDTSTSTPNPNPAIIVQPAISIQRPPNINLDITCEKTLENAYITIKPPPFVRTPLNLTLIVDYSGSMRDATTTKDAHGNTIFNGFSKMDLVKFAINTIVSSLNPHDIITIIKFNYKAIPVVLNKVIDDNPSTIQQIISTVNDIVPTGGTNIWDGLRLAFTNLEDNFNRSIMMNYSFILLTDGDAEPSTDPLGGYIAALEGIQSRHISKTGNSLIPTVHTLGFGNDINSKLLFDIANFANGTYNFIPDAGFVGTICVNLMVNIQMTAVNGCKLVIKYRNDSTEILRLGPIQYYNPKKEIISITDSKGGNISNIFIHYNFMERIIDLGNPIFWTYMIDENPIMKFRNCFLKYLTMSITKKTIDDMKTFKSMATILKERYPVLNVEPYIKAILEECNGEISMALSGEYIGKWGMHYLRSLIMAHGMELRNNFKDIAVQFYGCHAEFETLRGKINHIFNSLPAPKPSLQIMSFENGGGSSGSSVSAPISMASYNIASNGCFGSETIIMVTKDPKTIIPYPIPITDLRIGDWVLVDSKSKTYDRVMHITIHTNPNSFPVIKFNNGLVITPYHPVIYNGVWQFPINMLDIENDAAPIGSIIDYSGDVFNIVLNSYPSVELYGWKCITLAHGIIDDPIAYHEYLGSEDVIDDIEDLEKDEFGRVIITPNMVKRDKDSNLIVGFGY